MTAKPAGEMCCPTCSAVQQWSPVCRRCKCDLELLQDAHVEYRRAYERGLLALAAGQPREAIAGAEEAWQLAPKAEAARLLALSHLFCGEWQSALDAARRANREVAGTTSK